MLAIDYRFEKLRDLSPYTHRRKQSVAYEWDCGSQILNEGLGVQIESKRFEN